MKKKLIRTYAICLALIPLIVILSNYYLSPLSKDDFFVEDVFVNEIPKISFEVPELDAENISIEEAFKELNNIYYYLIPQLESAKMAKEEMESLFEEMSEKIVCSEKNKVFNLVHENYQTYSSSISLAKNYLSQYETYFAVLNSNLLLSPDSIYEEYEDVLSSEEALEKIHTSCQEIADEAFETDYEQMCHLVNGEGGNCLKEEQYYIANVAENRQKHPEYEDTLYKVIHESGQYACLDDGNYYKNPTRKVRKNVEDFLRGRVETGMPENVVFQALFKQGDGTWNPPVRTKHFFCYKN